VYSDEEQQSPTSHFDSMGSNQPVYDSYESDSELEMQDFQEHTTESYPLFTKGKYCEEINHPWPAGITEQQIEEKSSSMVLFMMIMTLTLGRAKKEEEEKEGQFISCPEPISEKPSPEDQSACISFSSTCAYQRYSAMCEQLWSRSGCLLQIFWSFPLVL
jgi:hypothetical protein